MKRRSEFEGLAFELGWRIALVLVFLGIAYAYLGDRFGELIWARWEADLAAWKEMWPVFVGIIFLVVVVIFGKDWWDRRRARP